MKKRGLKRYNNLNVPWHTHLYRGALGIFVSGEIPWHKHIYRSYRSISGDPKFALRPTAYQSTPPIEVQELLFRVRRLEHELNALRIRHEAISRSYEDRLAQLTEKP